MKYKYVCNTCGSDEVFADAWASWSPETNQWVLETVFEYRHCQACEGETNLKKVELDLADEC
jgi:hypothetical protein